MSPERMFLSVTVVAAILVAASAVHELVSTDGAGARWRIWLQGILLGVLSAAAFAVPRILEVGNGVVGPMVLLLLAGLIFEPLPVVVAMLVVLPVTVAAGAGAAVVLPVLAGGVAGMAIRRWWPDQAEELDLPRFLVLGMALGAGTAAWGLLVGSPDSERPAFQQAVMALVLTPLATALAGEVLAERLRRAEVRRQLVEEEERLRLALDSSGQRMFDLDVGGDTVVLGAGESRAIEGMVAAFAGGAPELIGRIHPEDRAHCSAVFGALMRGEVDRVDLEYRVTASDGGHRWIRTVGRVVRQGPDGRPRRIVGTNADTTAAHAAAERERQANREHQRLLDEAVAARRALLSMVEDLRLTQRTLEESLERYTALVRHSPDAILVNRDDRIVLVNDALLRLVGAEDEGRLLGIDPVTLFVPEMRDQIRERIRLVREAREPVPVREFRLLRLDGSTVDIEGAASPFEDHEGIAIHVVLRDISARKAAERAIVALNEELELRVAGRTAELQHAYRELESFSYSVSHDLRAPLRAITGFAQILERRNRDQLDESGRHYLDNISTAGERMGALIEDLLGYSRIGRRDVRREPLDVPTIADNVFGTLAPRIVETGASVALEGSSRAPMGDPVLFEQILLNLVSNGITYARDGVPPDVTILLADRGERVEVSVRDNGIGIAPEHRERIFEVFARLHAEDDIPGTGIGLAIVRKATRLMEGDIVLESTPEEGSTFTLSLPAAAVPLRLPEPVRSTTQVSA